MPADTARERIEAILVDTYDEHEQAGAWENAFQDDVRTPFRASLFGVLIEVQGFQSAKNATLQCLAVGGDRKRWIGVADLDPEGLPDDFIDILGLYQSWLACDY